jgi:hypothetical protein
MMPREKRGEPMTDAIRTIALSSRILAQGEVLARHSDGSVSIDAGGSRLCGAPIASLRTAGSAGSVT